MLEGVLAIFRNKEHTATTMSLNACFFDNHNKVKQNDKKTSLWISNDRAYWWKE